MNGNLIINIPVAIGELVDKMTILDIKLIEIKDQSKLHIVKRELGVLTTEYNKVFETLNSEQKERLEEEYKSLASVNRKLWNIEDKIRDKERNKEFDNEFIEIARSVYYTNDERCAVKNKINAIVGSYISEVKSYKEYK